MATFFNEFDPFAANWLKNLFPEATIDERTIFDVEQRDLDGFDRVHFFGGIGGWEYALRLAGWPQQRQVWSGSCPCQPFSDAGLGKGEADKRHLWPELRRLIAQCRPSVVFGEQVAYKLGRRWFAGVRADLEALGYAVGAAGLPAASVGAPHRRERIFWVAEPTGLRFEDWLGGCDSQEVAGGGRPRASGSSRPCSVADANVAGREGGICEPFPRRLGPDGNFAVSDFWRPFDLIECRDGKSRRVEPGTFPLADGVPNRVGRLRGYGNAIVPQVAAVFVTAFLEILKQ